MSSHREAPAISKDPVADSTDVYAFVSPDNDDTVTILANYIPLEDPAAGPNFFEFGSDVLYEIHIDNTGSGTPAITYQFNFTATITDPGTFLYATGPITSLTDPTWNRRQTYTITKVSNGESTVLSSTSGSTVLSCPPCNIGPRSTPNYSTLAGQAIYRLSSGETVFAGQRAEGFFVDLGAVFDLGDLRPLSPDQLIPGMASAGINAIADKNVHTIAIQVPISSLTRTQRAPSGANDPNAVIGVWTTASRRKVRLIHPDTGTFTESGPFAQVSRLGSPLVNEVVVPMNLKDYFNSQPPLDDKQFAAAVEYPELQRLLPVLYPGAFDNLKAYTKARADLVAIFATGIPGSVIGPTFGYGTYQGGKVIAEMLRLNMGIKPTGSGGGGTSNLGLLGGDLAGFPNGRRVTDDVVTIELKAVAGATIPLVDPSYTPDAAVGLVTQDVASNPQAYQTTFPYLAEPHPGFWNPQATPVSSDSNSLDSP
jgi:hypothetical protein